MSTATHPATFHQPPETTLPGESIFRLSVEQYHQMIQAGILTNDDRVELLEGWLIQKMSKNPPHTVVNRLITAALAALLPEGWHVGNQDPITTTDSEPEPDVTVIRGKIRDYISHHPGPSDVALVAEVADSSLARDRGIKRRIYARAAVPVYWIIDAAQRRIEICTAPSGPAEHPAYTAIQTFGESDLLPVVIDGHEIAKIAARDILP